MRILHKVILTFAAITISVAASAVGADEVRINEILVKNVDNYEDDYGHRSSWIELYNTSHSTVDVGGCYFKAIAHGTEYTYRIPTGDPRTVIGPLGYCIFFCEGTGTKGTMYTNFTMEGIEYLALLTSRGKGKPIDEVWIDYDAQIPDVSIGFLTMDSGEVAFGPLPRTTPNATNDLEPELPRSEQFRQRDQHGFMMFIIAITVVLSVLILLTLLFKVQGNYMISVARKKTAQSKQTTSESMGGKSYQSLYSGEEIAAIAMALQKYTEELHDKESAVLTINKVARAYSPWSSKIYGLQQFTRNKFPR